MAVYSQPSLSQPVDYRSERAERRTERAAHNSSTWMIGVMLIELGVIFTLQNMGALVLKNWWALFILIPALGSFGASYTEYRNSGRLNAKARGPMLAGLVFTAVAPVFLFNLSFGLLLPIILIGTGIGLLIDTVLPD